MRFFKLTKVPFKTVQMINTIEVEFDKTIEVEYIYKSRSTGLIIIL